MKFDGDFEFVRIQEIFELERVNCNDHSLNGGSSPI